MLFFILCYHFCGKAMKSAHSTSSHYFKGKEKFCWFRIILLSRTSHNHTEVSVLIPHSRVPPAGAKTCRAAAGMIPGGVAAAAGWWGETLCHLAHIRHCSPLTNGGAGAPELANNCRCLGLHAHARDGGARTGRAAIVRRMATRGSPGHGALEAHTGVRSKRQLKLPVPSDI